MKKLFSILCIISLISCSTAPSFASQPLSQSQQSFMRTELLQMINHERKKSVRLYSPLLKTTNLRAQEAFKKWSHTRPNKTRWNTTIKHIINIKRIPHGENLAKITIKYKSQYSSQDLKTIAKQIHKSLIKSNSHYKVMTNPKYKKMNIGIYSQIQKGKLVIVVAQHYIQ